jgi:hypothetical protein
MPVGPGDLNVPPPTGLFLDFVRERLPAAMDCTVKLIDVWDTAFGLEPVRDDIPRPLLLKSAWPGGSCTSA